MPPVVSSVAIPREADRVAILINPVAGPRSALPNAEHLAGLLNQSGFHAELFSEPQLAAEQANRWHAEGRLRALVGVGGDGTAADLLNRAAEGVPLSFLAAGNSNLLARYFRLSEDPVWVARTLVDGLVVRVDAGEANGRLFAIMFSCGFDAEVVRRVHQGRHGHISLLSYIQPMLKTIGDYEFPEIYVHLEEGEGAPASLGVRWLFVFNLPCYGGGFRLAPQAVGADGQLDLCGLRRGHLVPSLWYLMNIICGRHQSLSDCTIRRVRKLRISADAEIPYQLDGDPGGCLPVEVRILPGRLTLVVPRTAIGKRLANEQPDA